MYLHPLPGIDIYGCGGNFLRIWAHFYQATKVMYLHPLPGIAIYRCGGVFSGSWLTSIRPPMSCTSFPSLALIFTALGVVF